MVNFNIFGKNRTPGIFVRHPGPWQLMTGDHIFCVSNLLSGWKDGETGIHAWLCPVVLDVCLLHRPHHYLFPFNGDPLHCKNDGELPDPPKVYERNYTVGTTHWGLRVKKRIELWSQCRERRTEIFCDLKESSASKVTLGRRRMSLLEGVDTKPRERDQTSCPTPRTHPTDTTTSIFESLDRLKTWVFLNRFRLSKVSVPRYSSFSFKDEVRRTVLGRIP